MMYEPHLTILNILCKKYANMFGNIKSLLYLCSRIQVRENFI